MAWTERVTPVDAPHAPRDPTDTYPSHLASYGRGGHHYAATTTARDAIPSGRLELGMFCYVEADGKTYQLTDTDPVAWTEFAGSGSGTSATSRIIGRVSAGSGAYEQLTLGDGLEFSGSSVQVAAAVSTQIDSIETTVTDYSDGIEGGTW